MAMLRKKRACKVTMESRWQCYQNPYEKRYYRLLGKDVKDSLFKRSEATQKTKQKLC